MPAIHPARALLVAAGLLAACSRDPDGAEPWRLGYRAEVLHAAEFQEADLIESSGVAVSRTYPGVLWTINDAGNLAHVFASDTAGTALSRWRFQTGQNVDWEDIALGPCPAGNCLYVGDVGDNRERRRDVTIYRFAEPDPAVSDGAFGDADSLVVRYPDRPRDVEAMFVDSAANVWLVSKGRSDGILLYRVPATAWRSRATTADLVDTLPIEPHLLSGKAVTGASISLDQRRVVIRTYRELYFFARSPDGRLVPEPPPNRCDVNGLEVQGEGVDWWDDSTLVLTSEGRGGVRGTIHLVRCG